MHIVVELINKLRDLLVKELKTKVYVNKKISSSESKGAYLYVDNDRSNSIDDAEIVSSIDLKIVFFESTTNDDGSKIFEKLTELSYFARYLVLQNRNSLFKKDKDSLFKLDNIAIKTQYDSESSKMLALSELTLSLTYTDDYTLELGSEIRTIHFDFDINNDKSTIEKSQTVKV
jgi:hypothetical protein